MGGGDLSLLSSRTKWEQTWGYDIGLYTPVLLYAREKRIRLCGLNAPYELVTAVSQLGVEGLDPQLRNLLPTLDLGNREHRARFVETMESMIGGGVHAPMSRSELQRSYEAMTLWDEYMAASIAGYVSNSPRPGAGLNGGASLGTERMVVLVGSSHVRGRVGIPDRFTRRTGLQTFTVRGGAW